MNFAEGLRGLGFSDADISFLHRDYAFESMCKDMKIKPYMRNKSETKIILLYLFKSRLSKNRKNQKIAYSLDTKHFICHFLSYPFQPILESGKSIPKGGTVVLYTEEDTTQKTAKVPDFKGMSVSRANAAAVNAGLNIQLSGLGLSSGEAKASGQSLAAGTEVPIGTVVTVEFVYEDNIE